jgi:hypothetical protein
MSNGNGEADMPRIILLTALFALAGASAFAQQPLTHTGHTPPPGSPGTATPQPYAPVTPQHLPIAPASSLPLMRPAPELQPSPSRTDKDLPLLREQRERNARPLEKSGE